ncbi:hypothetical protein Pint_14569 [Pistacia integerrima]|uniref:Uncharacterized protein n=1 Tax=Pistacia integerrima TaxID=434235 RepID=A0ACC0Y5A6_9ROSI|nr:hypothetical protein Pint_14569 [Pistacia integerrima]
MEKKASQKGVQGYPPSPTATLPFLASQQNNTSTTLSDLFLSLSLCLCDEAVMMTLVFYVKSSDGGESLLIMARRLLGESEPLSLWGFWQSNGTLQIEVIVKWPRVSVFRSLSLSLSICIGECNEAVMKFSGFELGSFLETRFLAGQPGYISMTVAAIELLKGFTFKLCTLKAESEPRFLLPFSGFELGSFLETHFLAGQPGYSSIFQPSKKEEDPAGSKFLYERGWKIVLIRHRSGLVIGSDCWFRPSEDEGWVRPDEAEILELSKLETLDASFNVNLELQKSGLKSLVEKLTHLKVLFLDKVNISSSVLDILANLSSLTALSLRECELQGEFTAKIFQLPNLHVLSVRYNPSLSGYLPEFEMNSPLEDLRLAGTGFSGKIPYSIRNLGSLLLLDISNCSFSGSIPSSLGNLTKITYLYLNGNEFSGELPIVIGNLPSLEELHPSYNSSSSQDSGSLSWMAKYSKLTF